MGKNKIRYGLSNVHVFPITKDEVGQPVVYGEVIKVPGAVTIALSPEGSADPFYADNYVYYMSSANNGYSGSLEIALIPDEFYTQILGMYKDTETGALLESTEDRAKEFGLAFQFEADVNGIRHLLYRCKATRPNIEGETKGESVDPKTESLDFTSMARIADGRIRVKVEQDSTAYATFYDKPFEIPAPTTPVEGQ